MAQRRLDGKVAVVTGGGGGIGRETALALAEEGAHVVVNDVFKSTDGVAAADAVVEKIKKVGGSAVSDLHSVATMAGAQDIIKTAVSHFGRIDILINCAAIFKRTPSHEISEEEWNTIIDVNLRGDFNCVKAALPHMVGQKSGRIINFSSPDAFYTVTNVAFATAEAGIMGLTAMLARVLKADNITVNAILPSVATATFPSETAPRGDNIPIAPSAGPESVAPLVLYLAMDEARDMTGQFVYASGGNICIYPQPLKVMVANGFLHKRGKWTLEELTNAMPAICGLS